MSRNKQPYMKGPLKVIIRDMDTDLTHELYCTDTIGLSGLDGVQSSLFSEKPFSRDYVESVHNFIIESVEFAGKRIDMHGIIKD